MIGQSLTSYIGGRSIASTTSELPLPVIDPSTGRQICEISAGRPGDVDLAVSSSRAAYQSQSWREMTPARRKSILHGFADRIERDGALLDRLDAEDMGKPISTSLGNARAAADSVRFYAEMVDKLTGEVLATDSTSLSFMKSVPRGVVGAITPWNFPTYNAAVKVAPALAAGNSIILKPSELAPRSSLRLAELALEADLAVGLFNVVVGAGHSVGAALAGHMDVDMISFTGSTSTGRAILEMAARSNMKVALAECGGKSPQIICADAVDIDGLADVIAATILTNQGQLCVAGSRLIVHRDIESILLAQLTERFAAIEVGAAVEPTTSFGPLASERQCRVVMDFISSGSADGAELVTGGARLRDSEGGYFVAPTIFRNVQSSARIAQEEIFGPVLAVTTFETVDEAIALANMTRYGLAAYAWTRDMPIAMRLANGVHAAISVNAFAPKAGAGAGHALANEPHGQSGVGVEGGAAGLYSYVRRKSITIHHG